LVPLLVKKALADLSGTALARAPLTTSDVDTAMAELATATVAAKHAIAHAKAAGAK
jgi:hypothetical protein